MPINVNGNMGSKDGRKALCCEKARGKPREVSFHKDIISVGITFNRFSWLVPFNAGYENPH